METSDGTFSYSSPKSMSVTFSTVTDNVFSKTQGNLQKVQIGERLVNARVTLVDTKANLENNIYPMEVYPDSVSVTFDRNIMTKSTSTATYIIKNIRLLQELEEEGDKEIEINLLEVI
jgi:hypothetical protein